MRWWIVLLTACSAAPRPAPPREAVTAPTAAPPDAAPLDAPVPRAVRSEDFGPIVDVDASFAPQDHEVRLVSHDLRVTLVDADPAHVELAPISGLDVITRSPDGMWGAEHALKSGAIVAGTISGDQLLDPKQLDRLSVDQVRFVGGAEQQRTVVIDRWHYPWFLMRSQDGGASWKRTELTVLPPSIATSRSSADLLVPDPKSRAFMRWIRIDRDGDLTTTVIPAIDPARDACASAVLWIQEPGELRWFDRDTHGANPITATGHMICAGDAVLVRTAGGVSRCTRAGCGPAQPAGDFSDLTSDGIATASVHDHTVRITRTDRAPIDLELDPGDRVVAMAVWNDVPTLVVLGANHRLHLAAPPP